MYNKKEIPTNQKHKVQKKLTKKRFKTITCRQNNKQNVAHLNCKLPKKTFNSYPAFFISSISTSTSMNLFKAKTSMGKSKSV